MNKVLEWLVPIQTVSESNRTGEHWSKKHKRHKLQKQEIWLRFRSANPEVKLPCHVKLTRISPRSLDSDNLVSAFKWIRDEIGAQLTGIKIAGRGDGDSRISWEYSQEKGTPQSIKLEISTKEDNI